MIGISSRTVERWRTHEDAGQDERCGPRGCPPNRLTPTEQAEAMALLTRPEYRGLSPKQPLLVGSWTGGNEPDNVKGRHRVAHVFEHLG
jgi:hypothetical protein